jgi:methyltransferase (TIGR00027 family)
MRLSDVSKTAIATLRSRVIESGKPRPLIADPMAAYCLERLAELATEEERALLFDRRLSTALTRYIALRARKYDALADAFAADHPGCLVVNLGCGFDTRYWRINHEKCEYVELDLPEIFRLKREVLGARLEYETLGASVLDPAWMDRVNPDGGKRAILLAEGLLMYLPKPAVVSLFGAVAGKFRGSRMVCEVVTEKYTRGLWKKIVAWKIKRQLGLDAGASYDFGVRDAREIKSYAEGLKVVGEWSYVEDPDLRPRILKYLGLSRTQWTVTVDVNPV